MSSISSEIPRGLNAFPPRQGEIFEEDLASSSFPQITPISSSPPIKELKEREVKHLSSLGYKFLSSKNSLQRDSNEESIPYQIENLMEMAKKGDLSKLQKWIQEDPSRLREKSKNQESLFYPAVRGDQLATVKWLYAQDSTLIEEVRDDKSSVLFLTVLEGRKEILDWLLEQGVIYSPKKFVEEASKLGYLAPIVYQSLQDINWVTKKFHVPSDLASLEFDSEDALLYLELASNYLLKGCDGLEALFKAEAGEILKNSSPNPYVKPLYYLGIAMNQILGSVNSCEDHLNQSNELVNKASAIPAENIRVNF